MAAVKHWERFYVLISLFITWSSAADVCSDGLGIKCPAADACHISLTVGASTPACGTSVPLSAWSSTPPGVSLVGCNFPDGKKLGLLMTDPDAPNCQHPKAKYWLHWLALNVGAGDTPDFSHADTIASFAAPTPPSASNGWPPFHRYQIIVFAYTEVKESITLNGVKGLMADRSNFLSGEEKFKDLFQGYEVLAETEVRTKRD